MNVTIVRMFEVINVIPYRTPLLGQGGVDAPLKKLSPSFEGAAGVVCSTTDNRWLEPTTPSALAKEAVRHFIDGRRHPSLAKEGSFARQKISSSSSSAASGCRQLMLIGHLAEARDT